MKKLDLPRPEDLVKVETPAVQTPKETFQERLRLRDERLEEIKNDKIQFKTGVKNPVVRNIGSLGYDAKYYGDKATDYSIAGVQRGINEVGQLFGVKVDLYTPLVKVNVGGRATTKYLLFGFDMDTDKTSSPLAKKFWSKTGAQPENKPAAPPAGAEKSKPQDSKFTGIGKTLNDFMADGNGKNYIEAQKEVYRTIANAHANGDKIKINGSTPFDKLVNIAVEKDTVNGLKLQNVLNELIARKATTADTSMFELLNYYNQNGVWPATPGTVPTQDTGSAVTQERKKPKFAK